MNRFEAMIAAAKGRPVLGAACYFYDPVFLEIAARSGFQVIWIEMEHAGITFAEAADLCRMAAGTGMLSMIRVPDAQRQNVLRGAECGPDMMTVPMADTVDVARDLVRFAKFAPEGERGHFGVSRALAHGVVESLGERQREINRELTLFAQIETVKALAGIEEIAAVPGAEMFVGPADLAASMGRPWETGHAEVLAAGARVLEVARAKGKKTAVACGAADFEAWARMGVDLMFCTSDIACLKMGAEATMRAAAEAVKRAESSQG